MNDRWFRPGWHHVLFLVPAAAFLFVFRCFGVPFGDSLKYFLGLFAFVIIPGATLFRAIQLKADRYEAAFLSLILGLTSTTLIYKIARLLRAEIVFFIWILFCAAVFVLRLVKNPPKRPIRPVRITPVALGCVFVFMAVFVMLSVDNYRNGLRQPDGSVVINTRAYDGFLRSAVVRELSHSVPPQMPFAAGFPLSYHYGMDLFNAIFYKHLHIGVLDLNHRLSMTFFFVLLVLGLLIFLRELAHSDRAAILGAFLVIFGGGGLSYLATVLWKIPQWGNVFYSFYFVNFINVNSYLPGLAIILAGFFALTKYLRSSGPAWLPLAAFLMAMSLEFKLFFAFPLFGALAICAAAFLVFDHDSRMLSAAAWTGAFSLPILLVAYLLNRGGPRFHFSLRFVDWIWFSLSNLKLRILLDPWTGLIHHFRITPASVLSSLAAVGLFFGGGFGLTALAFPALGKSLGRAGRADRIRPFLAVFALVCLAFFFFVKVTLDGKPRNFTNSYVYTTAPIILGLCWAELLAAFAARKRRGAGMVIIALVVAVSVPNSLRFLWIKMQSPQPLRFSAEFLEAADWLNRNSPAEAVILNAPDVRYACYFADRRVVLDNTAHSFASWHLTDGQIQEREKDIRRFFENPRLNGGALTKYHATFIWATARDRFAEAEDNPVAGVPCGTEQGVGVEKYRITHRLELVFRNNDQRLYYARELPAAESRISTKDE